MALTGEHSGSQNYLDNRYFYTAAGFVWRLSLYFRTLVYRWFSPISNIGSIQPPNIQHSPLE